MEAHRTNVPLIAGVDYGTADNPKFTYDWPGRESFHEWHYHDSEGSGSHAIGEAGIGFSYNTRNVTIYGKPKRAGTWKLYFLYEAIAGLGFPSQSWTIEIHVTSTSIAAEPELPTFCFVNQQIKDVVISALGGAQPYTFKPYTDPLPEGLVFNPATQKLTGTPKKAGPYHFWLGASDKNGIEGWKEFKGRVISRLSITPEKQELPIAILGRDYNNVELKASGGAGPYTWNNLIFPSGIPDGLTIDKTTGKISGKPSKAGTYFVLVNVVDHDGSGAQSSDVQVLLKGVTDLQLPTSECRCYFGSKANVCQPAEAAPDDCIARWRI